MAARLILVKSRETLTAAQKWKQDDGQENPASADPPGEAAADDPNAAERETLRRELEEAKRRYEREQFRAIAEMLRNEELVSSATLARGRDLSTEDSTHLRLSDLIVHIREVRRLYAGPKEALVIGPETSEEELHTWLLRQVRTHLTDFQRLLSRRRSRRERCLLFSALLQGCKTGALTVEQERVFGRIRVSRRPPSESGSRPR